ncbi:FKBP-type peptidyl-prolyl cis-trans isomerase [Flavilitoribacter nigricans]|nr:FKBP-type peptidyl-prolyl cis-trans isomerase [Flavilitoribacter nigricans]
MKIEKHTVVTLHYKLQESSASGDLIEDTAGSDPLVFLHGVEQMIPEFERQLEGKSAGDSFAFGIKSADAYGEYKEEAKINIPIETFIVDGKMATDILVEGKTIPMRDQEGNMIYGTILNIGEKEVGMDFNHPMAGTDLYFSGKIEDVRAATPSEIEHRHVHGAGGHHH